MFPEENMAIVRRWFAALDAGDRATIDELCAPDYLDHSPPLPDLPRGRAGVRCASETFWAAFSDAEHQIEEQVAAGDKVLTRLRGRGVFSGSLLGQPPTGKVIELAGVSVHRLADGKLVEHWASYDVRSLMRQLAGAAADQQPSEPLDWDLSHFADVVPTPPHPNGPGRHGGVAAAERFNSGDERGRQGD
jgi:steroid delta-isomerase-like uncharacterized protein